MWELNMALTQKNYLGKMRFHDFVPLDFNLYDFNKVDVSINILDFASNS
jgi:hypothetical protein